MATSYVIWLMIKGILFILPCKGKLDDPHLVWFGVSESALLGIGQITYTIVFQDDDNDAVLREIARKEKERLRLQAKQKKEELEKLRSSANMMAEAGEVRVTCFVYEVSLIFRLQSSKV